MQGIILAAGKGKRLRPHTAHRSKAMMPIAGKPIVRRVMDTLTSNGVDDFVLVISPDDREIGQYFQREAELQAEVRFVYQVERKGMAHALQQAAPLIEEDFVLSACDNLVSPDNIARLMAFWQTHTPHAVLTLMPAPVKRILSGATVGMDSVWVTQIIEKPKPEQILSDLASLPLYIFTPRILDYVPHVQLSARGEYELQDAIQMLIAQEGHVGGVVIDSRMTLTNAEDLLTLNRVYMAQGEDAPLLAPRTMGANTKLITPLRIETDVTLGANCTLGPNVYIERNCHIGEGVSIRDAVLLRGTRIEKSQDIQNQVISA